MSTALIIGAGQRVGQAVADAFAKAGYNVAVASRSGKVSGDYKHFSFDATKPESAADLFAEVRESVGIPSVVIYNAYGAAYGFKKGKPVDVQGFNADMHVNATTPFTSAMEAIKGFEELKSNGKLGPEGATFIFTGNILNDTAAPGFLAFAMQKAASAVMIKNLALVEYKDEPFKFYYGDQRKPDGMPVPVGLSGPAHAETYLKLAQTPEQGPWQATFVEGVGVKEFPKMDTWSMNKL